MDINMPFAYETFQWVEEVSQKELQDYMENIEENVIPEIEKILELKN